MVAAIIPIILALISYFTSKKAGADDATAAGIAAAAGLGSYYVLTETDWGKSVVTDIEDTWADWFGSEKAATVDKVEGTDKEAVLKDKDGNTVGTIKTNPDGTSSVFDAAGKLIKTVTGTAGDVLKSWGATGTATVIGTAAVASSDWFEDNWPWLAGGAAALFLLR